MLYWIYYGDNLLAVKTSKISALEYIEANGYTLYEEFQYRRPLENWNICLMEVKK